MPKVAERADLSVVETDLVPRINQLCLATTNAGVRVAAFSGLAALAGRLPKDHALRSLSTIHKVTGLKRMRTPTTVVVLACLDSCKSSKMNGWTGVWGIIWSSWAFNVSNPFAS